MNILCRLVLLMLMLYSFNSSAVDIELAPDSLRQWYKPENKRNVWQHNMFKLRRELQAIQTYAAEENWSLTSQWAEGFVVHYRKIADMVPEWEDELRLEASDRLLQATKQHDMGALQKALRSLRKNCNSCHRSFRDTVALSYRAPDFSKQEVTDEQGNHYSYQEYMEELMFDLNSVVIANTDKNYDVALDGLTALRSGIEQLGESCVSCHEDTPEAREYYLGAKTDSLLSTLQQSLVAKKTENIGQNIGALAVHACAKCHGVHRISADMRTVLEH